MPAPGSGGQGRPPHQPGLPGEGYKLKSIIKLLAFLLAIFVIVVGAYLFTEKWRFESIVIHHSASAVDNYHSIAEYHRRERGWGDAAYHLILSNGSTEVPAGFLEATGRYRNLAASVATKNLYYNLRAIHICVVGDYDRHEMLERLQLSLVDVIRQLQERYGIADDRILFHRDCSSSACPGRFITKEKLHHWLVAENSKCPIFLKVQHERVIDSAWQWLPRPVKLAAAFSLRASRVLKDLLHADPRFQPIA